MAAELPRGYRAHSALAEAKRSGVEAGSDCTDRLADIEPGLAEWLSDIIDANASKHGVRPEHATWE